MPTAEVIEQGLDPAFEVYERFEESGTNSPFALHARQPDRPRCRAGVALETGDSALFRLDADSSWSIITIEEDFTDE